MMTMNKQHKISIKVSPPPKKKQGLSQLAKNETGAFRTLSASIDKTGKEFYLYHFDKGHL